MEFTMDMVHIFPGYPKRSTDNPSITLLAFYLQLPQGFSDNIVKKDVLKAIVESDEPSIGGSVGGTILGVQPLISTTETTEESDKEPKPMNAIVVGASVGGVILVVVILIALLFRFKRRKRLIAAKRKASCGFNNNAYLNDAYCIGPGEREIEMKCGDQAFSAGNVPDFGEHSYAAYNDLYPSSNHSAVILKFPDSLAGKNSEDVAAPIYQKPDSGVDTLIYQPINSGGDGPIYQPLNSNRKSSEV
ncbi:uncharacterized protein LOC110059180 [Orbicella faveolata]|uniref:uncharacterized protein LOC110059180 n=1 Tax=Orbicella faveolata TaxID=48498 RepID=UPI0009E53CC3|nr:uncharacterized protein LOC110059180 [Orbicella faveolata]